VNKDEFELDARLWIHSRRMWCETQWEECRERALLDEICAMIQLIDLDMSLSSCHHIEIGIIATAADLAAHCLWRATAGPSSAILCAIFV